MLAPNIQVKGFLSDLEASFESLIALENLDQNATTNETITISQSKDNTASVLCKKENNYYLHFNVWDIMPDSGGNLYSLSAALGSLTDKDTIYISYTGDNVSVLYIIPFLNALEKCVATKIFTVNSFYNNAILLSTATAIEMTPFAAVTFTSGLSIDRNKYDKAWLPYLRTSYNKLVDLKLLTEEECNLIFDKNTILFKTYKDFAELQG